MILTFLAPAFLPAQEASSSTTFKDRGVFEIQQSGRAAATETFEIQIKADRIRGKGEIEFAGRSASARKGSADLLLNRSWNLLSYRWVQDGPRKARIQVNYKKMLIELNISPPTGPHQVRKFLLRRDVAFLDDNFMHHFGLLVKRYDIAKGGSQMFQVLVPQQIRPGLMTVEALKKESVDLKGRNSTPSALPCPHRCPGDRPMGRRRGSPPAGLFLRTASSRRPNRVGKRLASGRSLIPMMPFQVTRKQSVCALTVPLGLDLN